MKKQVFELLAILSVAMLVGCEWDLGGSGNDWNDQLNWINFSGTYRGTGGNIVRNFTTSGSGSGGGNTGGGGSDGVQVIIRGEALGAMPINQTVLSGVLDYFPNIENGSVTLKFLNPANVTIGSLTDAGGILSGTFRYSGADPSDKVATGTLNYDTGSWVVQLQSPGFTELAHGTADYTYRLGSTNVVVDNTDDEDEKATAGGEVYSLTITQTGNQLYFTDSNGFTYTGTAWKGATPGGDDSGTTSGAVTLNYSVSGTVNGKSVKITGTLSGIWSAAMADDDSSSGYGNLTGRIIDGTWSEPGRTADVRGAATSDWVEAP